MATFRSLATEEQEPLPAGAEGANGQAPRLVKSEEGMVLRDNVFGTPEDDARRRDFTVNALSYNIADFSLIDYVGGMEDLERGIIRTIGDPRVRFTEDPVRMLRAVRFAALLGFTIEPATWEAMVDLGTTIDRAAPMPLTAPVPGQRPARHPGRTLARCPTSVRNRRLMWCVLAESLVLRPTAGCLLRGKWSKRKQFAPGRKNAEQLNSACLNLLSP